VHVRRAVARRRPSPTDEPARAGHGLDDRRGPAKQPTGAALLRMSMASPPPRRDYRVICADPPWTFGTWSDRGKGRSAEAHYDCMTLADIKALPVGDWAAPDCLLLLWATDPLLERALEVIRAWGFTYKTLGF